MSKIQIEQNYGPEGAPEEMDDDQADIDTEEDTDTESDTGADDGTEDGQEADPENDPADKETEEAEPDPDAELVVSIGEEEPADEPEAESAPEWVRDLRQKHRETARENRELRDRLKSLENPEPKEVKLGPKPKLSDHDYDEDDFEAALDQWHQKKREIEEIKQAKDAEEQQAKQEWEQKLNGYTEAKTKLKVKDFDDAEANVLENLSATQQGIILSGAENPALLVYALGKNNKRASELGAIKDPVKFAFAVAKLEKDLKVTSKKAPPPPERKVTGNGPKSGGLDNTLEKLREEAAKTGNYTKVIQYKRKKRQAKS